MQIELIRQENDAPSIYRDARGGALHHSCILTDDIAKAKNIAARVGARILTAAKVGDDGAVIYLDTGNGPGSILEILQPASGSQALFDMIKAASIDWDGSEPVRRLS
jgi:methylmalonyl-CoA/ethylmalonyl-CoA epimerase